MIITENMGEYLYMLRHLCRFMKEQGYYKPFVANTIRAYSSLHEHFNSIRELNMDMRHTGWKSFFVFANYVGRNYQKYWPITMPNNENFLHVMNHEWRQYVEDNNIEDKFLQYRKSKSKKTRK